MPEKLPDDTLNDVSSPASVEVFPEEATKGNEKQVRFSDKTAKKDQATDIPCFLRLTAERESGSASCDADAISDENQNSKSRLRGGGGKTLKSLRLLQPPPPSTMSTYCAQPQTNLINVRPAVPRVLPLLRLPAKYYAPETKSRCPQVDDSPCSHTLYVQELLRKYWQGIQDASNMLAFDVPSAAAQPNCGYYIPNVSLNNAAFGANVNDLASRPVPPNGTPCLCRPCPYSMPNTDAMPNTISPNVTYPTNVAPTLPSYNDGNSSFYVPNFAPNLPTTVPYNGIQNVPTCSPVSIPLVPIPLLLSPMETDNQTRWTSDPPSPTFNYAPQASGHIPHNNVGTSTQMPMSSSCSVAKVNACTSFTLPYSTPKGSQTPARVSATVPTQTSSSGIVNRRFTTEVGTCTDDTTAHKRSPTKRVPVCWSEANVRKDAKFTDCYSPTCPMKAKLEGSPSRVRTCEPQVVPTCEDVTHSTLRYAYYDVKHRDDGKVGPCPSSRIQVPVCSSKGEIERLISQSLLTVPTCAPSETMVHVTIPKCEAALAVLPCESLTAEKDKRKRNGSESHRTVLPCKSSTKNGKAKDVRAHDVRPCEERVPPCRSDVSVIPVCTSSEESSGEVQSARAVPACQSSNSTDVKVCESKAIVPSCGSSFSGERMTVVACGSTGWQRPSAAASVQSTDSHEDVVNSQRTESGPIPHCQHFHHNASRVPECDDPNTRVDITVPSCRESSASVYAELRHTSVRTCNEPSRSTVSVCGNHHQLNVPLRQASLVPVCGETPERDLNPRWYDSHEQMRKEHSVPANDSPSSTVCEPGQVFRTVKRCDEIPSPEPELHNKVLEELEKQRRILEDLCRRNEPGNATRTAGRETSGQDKPVPDNAQTSNSDAVDNTGIPATSTFVNVVTFTEANTSSQGLLRAGNPGHSVRNDRSVASQAAVFSRIHEQIEATIKFCVEAENIKNRIETDFQDKFHMRPPSSVIRVDASLQESKFFKEVERIVGGNADDKFVPSRPILSPVEENEDERSSQREDTQRSLEPPPSAGHDSLRRSRSTSPNVKKKSSSVTFETAKEPQIQSGHSTNSYDASRPSDHDATTPTRKWNDLQQAIMNARLELTQEPAVAPSTTKKKNRALVRQIRTSYNFRLRLQEACQLMEDIMANRPEPRPRQSSVVTPPPSTSRLSTGKSRTTAAKDGSGSSVPSPAKASSVVTRRRNRAHPQVLLAKPLVRMPFQTTPRSRIYARRNVTSTISEASDNGGPRTSGGRRRLIVKMTRATVLRKKLARGQIAKVNARGHSLKRPHEPTDGKTKDPLLAATYTKLKPFGLSTYTDRLRSLQKIKQVGSPSGSYLSDVSNPSLWEVPNDVRVILYGKDVDEIDNMDTDADNFESYSEDDEDVE